MSVVTKAENYLNYITGSAGGWPSLSNAGIIGNIDYMINNVNSCNIIRNGQNNKKIRI